MVFDCVYRVVPDVKLGVALVTAPVPGVVMPDVALGVVLAPGNVPDVAVDAAGMGCAVQVKLGAAAPAVTTGCVHATTCLLATSINHVMALVAPPVTPVDPGVPIRGMYGIELESPVVVVACCAKARDDGIASEAMRMEIGFMFCFIFCS